MAESRESTILDVKLDAGKVAQDLQDLITRIAALKAQQKELNEEIKAGNDVDGKYAEQLIRVKDQLAWTEKQAKGLSATTKLLNADTLTYSDSLNGERQKLADMQKAYDQLDRAQRESDGGKAFLEAIKAQSDAVKGLEEETGRAQRNVGNYPKAWDGVIGKLQSFMGVGDKTKAMIKTLSDGASKAPAAFKGIATSIGQATSAALKFIATPIGALIAAIVVAVKLLVAGFDKLKEAFAKNDQAGTSLAKLMASFQPIIDAVSAAFDKLAEGLGRVAEKLANWIGGVSEAAKAAQDLVQAQDNLEESERQYTEKSAQRNRDVAKLRAEAMDKEKYTYDQRRQMLQNAIKLEQKNLEDEKRIKAEQLRILEETAKRERDTSDETRNKIAAARAAMYQAEQNYFTGVRALQRQLTSFDTQEASEQKQAAEEAKQRAREAAQRQKQAAQEAKQRAQERAAAAKAAAKEAADAENARQENARKIAQEAEDFAISLIKDETEKAIALRKIQGEREIAELKRRLDKEKNLTNESREQLAALIKGKQAALDAELDQMATDAANKLTEEQVKAEETRAMRILEYKRELAESGSEEELAIQKEILDAQLAQELENVELSEEEKQLIRETFAKKRAELDKQYQDDMKKQAQDARAFYRESLMDTAANASKTFGAMSELLSQYGEENEEAAKASKAFGIAQIITDQAISIANTAMAISSAVTGAADAAKFGGPAAPFLLAGYIAAMVGAVLGALGSVASTISQAKQLMASADTAGKDAGKFATGGVVGGSSYTGDKLIAHVNSGEGIYTGTQANTLLQEIANNPLRGGASEELAAAMAEAVAAMPAPVMVLQEFREFEQKVSTFNELASIN